MNVKVDEKAEVVAEIVENAIVEIAEPIEKIDEVKTDIIVERAEESVRRAEEAVNIIETAAAIKVAEIAVEAEIKVAEHAEKVEIIKGSLEWANERIEYLENSMSQLWEKMDSMESKQLTPVQSEQLPPTVELEVNQSEGGDDLQNPIAELEQEVIPQQKRKYRAL